MAKVLFVVLFSVLLLVPIGAQQVFGTHLSPSCPAPGVINTSTVFTLSGTSNFCIDTGNFNPNCSPGYGGGVQIGGLPSAICGAPISGGTPTPAGSCQNGAVLDANDHCVPDFPNICSTGTMQAGFTCIAQAMNNLIGGTLLETNTLPLLVGAIGTNPIITGLVGITIAGIAGQAVWLVHRRKKSKKS